MAQVQAISAEEARQRLEQDWSVLLVDVRDDAAISSTGLGIGKVNISLGILPA